MVVTENRGPQVIAVASTFLILSWIAVVVRCYVKLFMTKLFRIDDWLSVAALLSFTIFCGIVLTGASVGTGRHITETSPQDFSEGMKCWYYGELTYITSTALMRASIGLLLLHICTNAYQKFIIWTVIIVTFVFSIAYFFCMTFQCLPVSYFWSRFIGAQDGTCMPATVIADMTYAHGAISTVSDWTLGILPIFLVWNLNMNPRTKVSVALVLGLGALGSTASIVRFPYIFQLAETSDFLWANTDVSIWSTVEPGLGIVASSMATMRPLFVAFFSRSKLFGCSSSHGNRKNRRGSQLGYLQQPEDVEVNDLEMQSNMTPKIRVTTTVTNTQSKYVRRDKEDSTKSNNSERSLKGNEKWPSHIENESLEDIRYCTMVESGQSV